MGDVDDVLPPPPTEERLAACLREIRTALPRLNIETADDAVKAAEQASATVEKHLPAWLKAAFQAIDTDAKDSENARAVYTQKALPKDDALALLLTVRTHLRSARYLRDLYSAGPAGALTMLKRTAPAFGDGLDELPDWDAYRAECEAYALQEAAGAIAAAFVLIDKISQVGTRRADDFFIQTGQEADALLRAIAEGALGRHWKSDAGQGSRTHSLAEMPHRVRLELTDEERAAGLGVDRLERMTAGLDEDACLAVLYVSRVLAPPDKAQLPDYALAAAWVDLDDVARKIWPAPRSQEERLANRARVYEILRFGERAQIIGKRTGSYRDDTGKEIPTRIDAPAWRFMSRERAADTSLVLWPALEVPLRVELVASREWTNLTTHPALAQYLPLGELLGGIPSGKAAGAWARVIGLALANHWRRNPRETVDGSRAPTRRELLTRYPPKISEPLNILASNMPGRALTFWHDALGILVEQGFLDRSGEALITATRAREGLPRYNWQEAWLDGRVDLRPGPSMQPQVIEQADSLPAKRPRQLTARRRRGPSPKARKEG